MYIIIVTISLRETIFIKLHRLVLHTNITYNYQICFEHFRWFNIAKLNRLIYHCSYGTLASESS